LNSVLIAIFFLLGNESNPATVQARLPQEDIVWLYDCMNTEGNDVPFESAIHILKRKLFPPNYEPSPWVPGEHLENIYRNISQQ